MVMKKIIVFSQPTEKDFDKILDRIFPKELLNKVLAYMPADGANCPQKYSDEWKSYAKNYQAEFKFTDNSKVNAVAEQEKLLNSNILVISGGNTFTLLHNLRRSNLFNTIQEFAKKEEFVIAGFSAGAIILSPTIEICNLPDFDENLVGIKDLTGLGIINFEVFPHYSDAQKETLEKYRKTIKNKVKTITNEKFIVINL